MVKPTNTTDSAQSTALVEVSSTALDTTAALHLETRFASHARRGSALLFPHKITWFTGNNKCRTAEGKVLPDIMGWAIEVPDLDERGLPEDYELIDAMQVLCDQNMAAEVIVQHPATSSAPARAVRYWSLQQVSLFVVCEGVPSKYEMQDLAMRWGVAYAWPANGDSQLHLRFFMKELMDAGYSHAFKARLSSYMTDRMLIALKSHERVLNYADKLRAVQDIDGPVPFYAYALPIVVSQGSMTAGKKEGQTKEVYYPVAAIPRVLSEEYLASVAITEEQAALLEENDFVHATTEWSMLASRRILNGYDIDAPEEAQVIDATPLPGDADAPPF